MCGRLAQALEAVERLQAALGREGNIMFRLSATIFVKENDAHDLFSFQYFDMRLLFLFTALDPKQRCE